TMLQLLQRRRPLSRRSRERPQELYRLFQAKFAVFQPIAEGQPARRRVEARERGPARRDRTDELLGRHLHVRIGLLRESLIQLDHRRDGALGLLQVKRGLVALFRESAGGADRVGEGEDGAHGVVPYRSDIVTEELSAFSR